MNILVRPRGGDAVLLAGERIVCDPSGVLVLPDLGMLVVSDLHLEKGSSHARRGALLPPYDTAATLLRLQAAIDRHRPRIVVALGDSFHDPDASFRLPDLFRAQIEVLAAGRDWYWVTGNHDPHAPHGLPGETVGELALGPLTLRHEPDPAMGSGEIAGHLHPCARIVHRGRSVRRRCFASDGMRLVMPAFGAFTGSLNVLDRAFVGLFRRESLMTYLLGDNRVFAIAGQSLRP